MKSIKTLLICLIFLSTYSLSFAQELIWRQHSGLGSGVFIPAGLDSVQIVDSIRAILDPPGNLQVQHGWPGGFAFADIPDSDAEGWEVVAPFGETGTINLELQGSQLEGPFSGLDFNYVETKVNITDPSLPFILSWLQVDDGARAYVFNEQHPNGAFDEDGDARTYFVEGRSAQLNPFFVEGENRIVVVHFDNGPGGNGLEFSVDYEVDPCANDGEAPVILNCPDEDQIKAIVDFPEDFEVPLNLELLEFSLLDNCTDSAALTAVFSPNVLNPRTTGPFTLEVTDEAGNTSETCVFNLDIRRSFCDNDTIPPQAFAVLFDGTEVLLSDLDTETIYDCRGAFESIVLRDNCDENPSYHGSSAGGVTLPDSNGIVTVTAGFGMIDASGNEASFGYTYRRYADTIPPQILTVLPDEITGMLDICNAYSITLESLGIEFTDDCPEGVRLNTQITKLGGYDIQIGGGIDGPGEYAVSVFVSDIDGNKSESQSFTLTLEPNPNAFSATAVEDNRSIASNETLTITRDELLVNDLVSDGSDLRFFYFDTSGSEVTITGSSDSTSTFTPNAGFIGTTEVLYVALTTGDNCPNRLVEGILRIEVTQADGIGANEPEKVETTMQLFPNPARDRLNIELAGEERVALVQVRDRLGTVVWSQKVADTQASIQLNLKDGRFTSGFYSVVLIGENGLITAKQVSIVR